MRIAASIIAAMAVAGCTPPLDITRPDVTARVQDAVPRERITSYRPMEVRTFTSSNGRQVELAGLSCALRSDDLTADVITPARVEMPRFVQSGQFFDRGRPAQLQVRCQGFGYEGAETVFALDKEVATATNAGVAGAVLTTVVTAAMASSTPWEFPPVSRVTVRADQ
ncbi:MAG: hypothetical protein AAGM21_16765 [Pseudomonadota bacterium]